MLVMLHHKRKPNRAIKTRFCRASAVIDAVITDMLMHWNELLYSRVSAAEPIRYIEPKNRSIHVNA